MPFEIVRFTVRDIATNRPLRLAGWWIPNPAGGDKTVVLIHGYADAKVGAIAWAPTWRRLGFHILVVDLRAHGESEGTYTTAGVFERSDMDQVINEFRASHPQQTRQLVICGISMGAAVALSIAGERTDVDALVLDCPYADFRLGARGDARLNELAPAWLLPIVLHVAQWLSGANLGKVSPVRLIPRIRCPIFIIQAGEDAFVSNEDEQAIEAALRSRPHDGSESWRVPDVAHLMALPNDPEEYFERIKRFLLAQLGDGLAEAADVTASPAPVAPEPPMT